MKKVSLSRVKRKLLIWINRRILPKEVKQLTRTERESFSIFSNLVKHSESELLINPVGKYYIKSPKVGIFITLDTHNREISIINHVYGYNVGLNERLLNRMESIFKDEVENRRVRMEEEYTKNIQHSLSIIAKTIKERL
jgi:hypothetical protein